MRRNKECVVIGAGLAGFGKALRQKRRKPGVSQEVFADPIRIAAVGSCPAL
jgi:hypothetical protein